MKRLRENVHALGHLCNQTDHQDHTDEGTERFKPIKVQPRTVGNNVDDCEQGVTDRQPILSRRNCLFPVIFSDCYSLSFQPIHVLGLFVICVPVKHACDKHGQLQAVGAIDNSVADQGRLCDQHIFYNNSPS